MANASSGSLMARVAFLVGLLLLPFGFVTAFLGAYMMNGEARHNLDEGIPIVVLGVSCVIAGFGLIVWAARKSPRRAQSAAREHDPVE